MDDGSSDRTASVVSEWADARRNVRLESIPHRGKGAAVRHGMLAARGRHRLLCDADLAMPVQWIGAFLQRMEEGYDIVIGSRQIAGARRFNEPVSQAYPGAPVQPGGAPGRRPRLRRHPVRLQVLQRGGRGATVRGPAHRRDGLRRRDPVPRAEAPDARVGDGHRLASPEGQQAQAGERRLPDAPGRAGRQVERYSRQVSSPEAARPMGGAGRPAPRRRGRHSRPHLQRGRKPPGAGRAYLLAPHPGLQAHRGRRRLPRRHRAGRGGAVGEIRRQDRDHRAGGEAGPWHRLPGRLLQGSRSGCGVRGADGRRPVPLAR